MMALMSSPRDQIAARVRAELAAARISGRQLAERLGVPADGLGRRLRGNIPFRADELVDIGRALGVDPARFLQGVGSECDEPPPDRLPAYAG